jgi:DNA repair exonuclease SbcCD nuclease subunit
MDAAGEHARYAPCSPGDLLARHYDYWALGHIHRRRVVHEDPPIVYPGNTQGRNIREAGPKGCLLVTVDGRGRPALEFQPLDVFRWHELPVSADGAADGDEVLQRVDGALREFLSGQNDVPAAVRVFVRGACPAHRQLVGSPTTWINQIRAMAVNVGLGNVWVEKVKFQTGLEAPLAATELDDGPLREIVTYLSELRGREDLLTGLAEELSALDRKLPDELRLQGSDLEPLLLHDPGYLRRVLDEVEPLLLARLGSQEGGS